MAHTGADGLVVMLWALLYPALLAGLGGALPGFALGLPVGLGAGVGLTLVARNLRLLERRVPVWHRLSRAWYVLLPLGAMLSGAGAGATLGFQSAAADALQTSGREPAQSAAHAMFELLHVLFKAGLIPPEVKTEDDLVRWVKGPLEAAVERQLDEAHGRQWLLMKLGRPMLHASAGWLTKQAIHAAFEAASEKSGLPRDQVRDLAIGILALGSAESEQALADGLLQLLVKLAKGLIAHGFMISAVPVLVVLASLLVDAGAHALIRREREAARR